MVKASNALKSACDIVFAGFSAGGPFQGTAIKTPAGRPCGLVGVSEFLEVKEFLAGECSRLSCIRGLLETTDGLHGRSQMETESAV